MEEEWAYGSIWDSASKSVSIRSDIGEGYVDPISVTGLTDAEIESKLLLATPLADRDENVVTRELTPEEMDLLFAEQEAAKRLEATSSRKNDIDNLINEIGNDMHLPGWARTNSAGPASRPASRPAARPPALSEAHTEDILYTLFELESKSKMLYGLAADQENMVGLIDETTVDTRDKVYELEEEMKLLQVQVGAIEDGVDSLKAQNIVLINENKRLHEESVSIKETLRGMIKLLGIISRKFDDITPH